MFRYLRALLYFLTGRLSKAREVLMTNEYVMAATYDKSIEKQENNFNSLKDAVAKILRIKIDKEQQFKNLTKEVERLSNVKLGAGNKAKQLAAKMQAEGKSAEDIKNNPEIIKCQGAFNDASSSLKDMESRLSGLDADIKNYDQQVAQYKSQLQNYQRGVENLRNEKSEAIADTVASKQIDEINSVLAGISTSTEDKDLADARRARQEMKAKAQISGELAGNNAKIAEDEYLKYADTAHSNSEFDNLLGLDAPAVVAEPLAASKLPEA